MKTQQHDDDRSEWSNKPRVTIFHDTIQRPTKKNIQNSEGDENTKLLPESQDKLMSKSTNVMAEFLQLHERMGHIPFQ